MLRILSGLNFPGAPAPELQMQPAGFDLTVRTVSRFKEVGALDLTNEYRRVPVSMDLPWPDRYPLTLSIGSYLITYNEEITIPPDCAGVVLPRSSLLRCGCALHSALWDPGYEGRGQGLLTVGNEIALYRDARIGQLVLISLERAAEELYSGTYQGEGLH